MEPKEDRPGRCQMVIELRSALGKTQQEFASEVLKTAVTTVARYETSHPPSGIAMIRLAKIADEHDLTSLRNELLASYLDEALQHVVEMGVQVEAFWDDFQYES